MKKLISLFMVFCVLACTLTTTVSAEAGSSNSNVSVAYLYTNSITISASTNSKGIFYRCKVSAASSATKISVYVYLQEYKNGVWKNVDVVSKAKNDNIVLVSDTYTSPISGRKYRAEAHIYVYSGSKYEYIEETSTAFTYSK